MAWADSSGPTNPMGPRLSAAPPVLSKLVPRVVQHVRGGGAVRAARQLPHPRRPALVRAHRTRHPARLQTSGQTHGRLPAVSLAVQIPLALPFLLARTAQSTPRALLHPSRRRVDRRRRRGRQSHPNAKLHKPRSSTWSQAPRCFPSKSAWRGCGRRKRSVEG